MTTKKKTAKQREAELLALLHEARDFIRAKACYYSGDRLDGSGAELVKKINEKLFPSLSSSFFDEQSRRPPQQAQPLPKLREPQA